MKRIVPGIHSVKETLKVRPKAISELWLREGTLREELEEMFHEAQRRNIRIKRVSQRSLDREVETHQGVIAHVLEAPEWPSSRDLKQKDEGVILVLDSLEDPHNVGSILRSAWNIGCLGVIVTRDRSAAWAPAAQKVASGAFEHVPVTEAANLHAELSNLKDLGFWIYGLEMEGSQAIFETELAPKSVIVIGSEESGLKKPVVSACDVLVRIPQVEGSNSFNASVAGAIAGYEFFRQRAVARKPEKSPKKP